MTTFLVEPNYHCRFCASEFHDVESLRSHDCGHALLVEGSWNSVGQGEALVGMKKASYNATPSSSVFDYKEGFVWSPRATHLLLRLYKENCHLFLKNAMKKKSVWAIIAQQMNKLGSYRLLAAQCENKWKSLTAAFRKAVDARHQVENASSLKFCPFFQEISQLYPYQPQRHQPRKRHFIDDDNATDEERLLLQRCAIDPMLQEKDLPSRTDETRRQSSEPPRAKQMKLDERGGGDDNDGDDDVTKEGKQEEEEEHRRRATPQPRAQVKCSGGCMDDYVRLQKHHHELNYALNTSILGVLQRIANALDTFAQRRPYPH